jgi:hypothetical protein
MMVLTWLDTNISHHLKMRANLKEKILFAPICDEEFEEDMEEKAMRSETGRPLLTTTLMRSETERGEEI